MTKFVAEVSSNHNRDLSRCIKFVDTAAELGCHGIKFQLFTVEGLFSPEAVQFQLDQQGSALTDRKKWELPTAFLPHIGDRCKEKGIKFVCTPFDLDAVQSLCPFVDIYKIASYELLWHDLLRACANVGKPVVLSTGMATMDEVNQAVKVLRDARVIDLAVLHCVSAYPTPVADCNLAAIEAIRTVNKCSVGWSSQRQAVGNISRRTSFPGQFGRIPPRPGWRGGRVRLRALLVT